MSDRLKDLQRQRALAQEQLAWLDREIARESGSPTPVIPPAAAPQPAPAKNTAVLEADAEKILEQYRQSSQPVGSEVKRGCFLYFFLAFGVLILGLTAFYLLRRF